ncbi:LytR C-terminal domain-containing protein [Flexivirga caeni]|uniref:LytR family transcriptional regulator n=1 Tax=Flexivirga caeni TaxID=2294115 RepID=A0A3M9M543_9MICO|nr:LytR C-terminal domain-containing protein [Flexivirga caeni]RNI20652.1 LytR family transcriptional regulator [Flexivirga caeni]
MGLTRRHAVGTTVALALAIPALAACSGSGSTPAATSSCSAALAAPSMKIPLSSIYINVWNATGTNGQAASVADQLKWRGLHIIATGNDPSGESPPAHAEIRFGPNGKQIALTVAQQVKDAVLEEDNRTNPSVDVVIGQKFALVPVPPPPPSKITVNVLNAFVIPGTATDVAADMRKRGFHVAQVGNTSDFYPDHAVIIRYGEQGAPAAQRVALQFHDVQMVQDGRSNATVDIVIGSKWTDSAIVPAAQATPKPTPSPTPTCRPLTTAKKSPKSS